MESNRVGGSYKENERGGKQKRRKRSVWRWCRMLLFFVFSFRTANLERGLLNISGDTAVLFAEHDGTQYNIAKKRRNRYAQEEPPARALL